MSNYALSGNPNTSPKTLDRLANDYDWIVLRLEVANNPNTPQYIKTYLRLKNVLET